MFTDFSRKIGYPVTLTTSARDASASKKTLIILVSMDMFNDNTLENTYSAKRAGWPKGLKGPEGTFRPFGPVGTFQPFGPAGALRRRLLHRNGNFATPSPRIRTRQWAKTDFRRKTGRSRAVYESIRKIPRGETTEISVPSHALIWFYPLMARNGPFRPFFGP